MIIIDGAVKTHCEDLNELNAQLDEDLKRLMQLHEDSKKLTQLNEDMKKLAQLYGSKELRFHAQQEHSVSSKVLLKIFGSRGK